jgi:hypothetical protein
VELGKVREFYKSIEQKILDHKDPEQMLAIEEQYSIPDPIYPCDIDEFKDFLSLNLENIGVPRCADFFPLLIKHLNEVLFYGMPIIISHKVGMNLMKCIANTLIAKSNVQILAYDQHITSRHVNNFLKSADRIVGLINFIGNFNETELIPIFENHKDKIIFLTVAYNRTLNYISEEFFRYCRYLNFDRIGVLSSDTSLTEDPASIEVQSRIINAKTEENRYQKILRKILEELNFSRSLVEQFTSVIQNEEDLCGILLFEILPFCTDVLQIKPFNISNQLNEPFALI